MYHQVVNSWIPCRPETNIVVVLFCFKLWIFFSFCAYYSVIWISCHGVVREFRARVGEYIFFPFPAKNERTIMHEFTPGSGDDRHAQCQCVPDLSHACHTNLSSLRDTKHSHITHFTLEGRPRFLSVPLAFFSFFLSACLPAILVSCLFFHRERTQNFITQGLRF